MTNWNAQGRPGARRVFTTPKEFFAPFELYRMRIENIEGTNRVIFNPNSKTLKGRRLIPMSNRVLDLLMVRCAARKEGWVFPSVRKGKHIGAAFVNGQWVKARRAAGLPEDLVLYRARHDFGTNVLSRTGNLKAVMDAMGHADVKIAMNYQHPELEIVRDAINSQHTNKRDRSQLLLDS